MAGVSRYEGNRIPGVAAAATTLHLRVKMDANGRWAIAGDEAFDGENDTANVTALGDEMVVYARTAPGTHIYVASKAIAVGDVCNTVAGGKVTDAAGVNMVCVAVTAAAADGDYFEGIPRGAVN